MGGYPRGPVGMDSNNPPTGAPLLHLGPPRRSPVRTGVSRAIAGPETTNDSRWLPALRQSRQWIDVDQLAVQLLGQQCFAIGVIRGMGGQLVTDIASLADLARILIMADLYDRQHRPGPWYTSLGFNSFGPLGLANALSLGAGVLFEDELRAAHEEREQLIAALRYALTHPTEVFGHIAQEYVKKWQDFEQHASQQSLSARYKAGQVFGEVLLEVLLLFVSGAGLVKLAAKVPQLAKAVTRLTRIAKSLPPNIARRLRPSTSGATPSAPRAEAPTTSQLLSQGKSTTPVTQHSGLHNKSWDDIQGKDFETLRKVDMNNLSAQEKVVKKTLLAQNRSIDDVKQLLTSGDNFRTKTLEPGDKLYGFDSTTNKWGAKNQKSMYWMDEAGYQDMKSKFLKDGTWDREGIKNYLALPCTNRADVIDMATVTKQHTAIESTCGLATEQVGYTSASQTTGLFTKTMPGGGTQITPNSSALSAVTRLPGSP